jgi:hypothetical protein
MKITKDEKDDLVFLTVLAGYAFAFFGGCVLLFKLLGLEV